MEVIEICGVVGLLYLARSLYLAAWDVWVNFARPLLIDKGVLRSTQVDWAAGGRWAVITGASDGIGKAMAMEMASRGLDIVLMSRTLKKLQQTAAEIESQYGVRTKVIPVDFGDGIKIYPRIRKELEDLDIGVLVNNVGTAYKFYEYFTQIPEGDKLIEDLFNINILSYCLMSLIALTNMEKRGRGTVFNIGSASGCVPVPFLSVYSSSKQFGHHLCLSLRGEYRQHGITIQEFVPYYIVTKLSNIKRVSVTTPKPQTYVDSAMKYYMDIPCLIGYPPHWALTRWFYYFGQIASLFGVNMLFQFGDYFRKLSKRRQRIKKYGTPRKGFIMRYINQNGNHQCQL